MSFQFKICSGLNARSLNQGSIKYYAMKSKDIGKGNEKQTTQTTEDLKASKNKGFSLSALVQLITMGAGAPSLGEYDYTDDSGRMFFKLEANRAYDEKGNSMQLKQKYFESGYVEDSSEGNAKPPGFFANLLSGGRLQTEWENSLKK